jgi:hypothetical protein
MAHSKNNNNNNNWTWEALQLTIGIIFFHCPLSKLKETLWNDLLYAHNCLLLIDLLLFPSLKHTHAHTQIPHKNLKCKEIQKCLRNFANYLLWNLKYLPIYLPTSKIYQRPSTPYSKYFNENSSNQNHNCNMNPTRNKGKRGRGRGGVSWLINPISVCLCIPS